MEVYRNVGYSEHRSILSFYYGPLSTPLSSSLSLTPIPFSPFVVISLSLSFATLKFVHYRSFSSLSSQPLIVFSPIHPCRSLNLLAVSSIGSCVCTYLYALTLARGRTGSGPRIGNSRNWNSVMPDESVFWFSAASSICLQVRYKMRLRQWEL